MLFAGLAIALMVADAQFHQLDKLRRGLMTLVYPIQAVVDMPGELFDWASENLSSREQLLAENRELKRDNLKLAAQVQQLAALEQENRRLRALMDSAERLDSRVRVAEIVRIDLDPFRHLILINKGTADGVTIGQPILDAFGVMGQVIHVGLHSAQAMLITDPSHAIPVVVNRNGLRTIAVGTGDLNRLSLPYLPNAADIVPGDLLLTSGLGGRFPAGYPVARVTEVTRKSGSAFADIIAEPVAALDRSREVLLVFKPDSNKSPNKQQQTEPSSPNADKTGSDKDTAQPPGDQSTQGGQP